MTDHRAEALRLLQEADGNPQAHTLVTAAQVHALLHASDLQERMLAVSGDLIEASRPPAAGIRDTARQAAGQPATVECPQCGDTGACNGGPCAHPAAGQPATQQAGRATALREAADLFEERCPDANGDLELCMCHAADELRRMADEAGQ